MFIPSSPDQPGPRWFRLAYLPLLLALVLAACSGDDGGSSAAAGDEDAAAEPAAEATPEPADDAGGDATPAAADDAEAAEEPAEEVTLDFTLWGGDVEIEAFRDLADQFESEHEGVTINLDQVPFDGVRARIDTGLAGGDVPDLFRVTFTDIGSYSSAGVLADLGDQVDDDFLPAFASAVTYEDTVYGVPHHTDTSGIIYRADYMEQIGVEPPTENIEDAWTWDETLEVARRLQEETDADFGFMYNFQQGGAFRWLSLLYQFGGSLTNEDFTAATINDEAGLRALEFTKSWFDEGLVPPNSSLKTSERSSDLFPTGTIGMGFMGNFNMPEIEASGVPWGVTFLPQAEGVASEVGGNAVVVPAAGDNVDIASEFAGFLGSAEAMEKFVTRAGFLPVRTSLTEKELEYEEFAEEQQLFVQQAAAIPEHLVREVTAPGFATVNQALLDQLDLTLVGGQDPQTTLDNLAAVVEEQLVTTE